MLYPAAHTRRLTTVPAPEPSWGNPLGSSLISHFFPSASLIWKPTLYPSAFTLEIVHGLAGVTPWNGPVRICSSGTDRTWFRLVNHVELDTSSYAFTFAASRLRWIPSGPVT